MSQQEHLEDFLTCIIFSHFTILFFFIWVLPSLLLSLKYALQLLPAPSTEILLVHKPEIR